MSINLFSSGKLTSLGVNLTIVIFFTIAFWYFTLPQRLLCKFTHGELALTMRLEKTVSVIPGFYGLF